MLSALTEEYNGTAWTEVADLSIARERLAGTGTTTAALAFGGSNPSGVVSKQQKNGTGAGVPVGAWSTGGSLNTARASLAGVLQEHKMQR